MRGPHNIVRLVRTGATLERTGAMALIMDAFEAPPLVRATMRFLAWPFQWLGDKGDPASPAAPRALTALGPAYIKFGQILSTRPDLVGEELAGQLRVLQDKLPPFPVEVARQSIADELGRPVDAAVRRPQPAGRGRLDRAGAQGPAARHRRGGGRQGAAPGDRAAFRRTSTRSISPRG